MSAQQIFDTAARHLLTQNAMAFNEADGVCAYRCADGKMCAVGVLIPDDRYDPAFEGNDAYYVAAELGWVEHGDLLMDLQGVHDGGITHLWRDQLRRVAHIHNLNTEVLDQ